MIPYAHSRAARHEARIPSSGAPASQPRLQGAVTADRVRNYSSAHPQHGTLTASHTQPHATLPDQSSPAPITPRALAAVAARRRPHRRRAAAAARGRVRPGIVRALLPRARARMAARRRGRPAGVRGRGQVWRGAQQANDRALTSARVRESAPLAGGRPTLLPLYEFAVQAARMVWGAIWGPPSHLLPPASQACHSRLFGAG